MRISLKKSLIAMTAIALTFATVSYAEPQKGMAMRSSAMTKGHGAGMQVGRTLAGHPAVGSHRQGHHSWKETLSKAQMEKMETMHLTVKREMAPLGAELEFKKAQLKNLVTTTSPDMAAVKSKIKEISGIKAKMMTNKYSHIVEMREVLTLQQRQRFDLDLLSGVEHSRGHKGLSAGFGHSKGRSCGSGHSKGRY